jgi:hypothetical protein
MSVKINSIELPLVAEVLSIEESENKANKIKNIVDTPINPNALNIGRGDTVVFDTTKTPVVDIADIDNGAGGQTVPLLGGQFFGVWRDVGTVSKEVSDMDIGDTFGRIYIDKTKPPMSTNQSSFSLELSDGRQITVSFDNEATMPAISITSADPSIIIFSEVEWIASDYLDTLIGVSIVSETGDPDYKAHLACLSIQIQKALDTYIGIATVDANEPNKFSVVEDIYNTTDGWLNNGRWEASEAVSGDFNQGEINYTSINNWDWATDAHIEIPEWKDLSEVKIELEAYATEKSENALSVAKSYTDTEADKLVPARAPEPEPNPSYRGEYANAAEIDLISTPTIDDFADNAETGTEWNYITEANPHYRGIVATAVDLASVENSIIDDFADNTDTGTEWNYIAETDPHYRGVVAATADLEGIESPVIDDFVDNTETGTEWIFGGVVWSDSESAIGTTPHDTNVWNDSENGTGTTPHDINVWNDSEEPIGTTSHTVMGAGIDGLMTAQSMAELAEHTETLELVQERLSSKVGKADLSVVVKDWAVSASGTQVLVTLSVYDSETDTESEVTRTIPVVSDTAQGVMTPEAYESLQAALSDIAALKGANKRYPVTAELTSGMDSAAVQAVYEDKVGVNNVPTDGDTLISFNANSMNVAFTYFGSDSSWHYRGLDSVGIASVAILGAVAGASDSSGNAGKIFVETDGSMSVLGWDAFNTAFTNHLADTNNPHSVTKTQVGLGNVDNTADMGKPVSTAQAAAIATKQNSLNRTVSTKLDSTTAATDTGGNITPGVSGILPIASGGTGATDPATARSNLGAMASGMVGFQIMPQNIVDALNQYGFRAPNAHNGLLAWLQSHAKGTRLAGQVTFNKANFYKHIIAVTNAGGSAGSGTITLITKDSAAYTTLAQLAVALYATGKDNAGTFADPDYINGVRIVGSTWDSSQALCSPNGLALKSNGGTWSSIVFTDTVSSPTGLELGVYYNLPNQYMEVPGNGWSGVAQYTYSDYTQLELYTEGNYVTGAYGGSAFLKYQNSGAQIKSYDYRSDTGYMWTVPLGPKVAGDYKLHLNANGVFSWVSA